MNDDTHSNDLTGLPGEMLEHILTFLDPESLFAASRTCRSLRGIGGTTAFLQDVNKKKRVEHDSADFDKVRHLHAVHDTITSLLKNASCNDSSDDESATVKDEGNRGAGGEKSIRDSRNVSRLRQLMASNEPMAQTFMQQSSLFERMRKTAWLSSTMSRYDNTPTEEHQMSARLHCLYGRPILKTGRTRSNRSYPYACSRVYDMRLYTTNTMWGPFREDGSKRVDWEKVEAINIVLSHNVGSQWPQTKVFDDIWDTPFSGSFPKSQAPVSVPRSLGDLASRDPYGVTGAWYRVVCFLDYSDFFHYNFSMGGLIPHNTPRQPLNVGEATRLIIMDLNVTSIEDPGPEDGQGLPIVHFEGESRSIHHSLDNNANSELRGSVRLTREGEVRWTTVSIFHGQERWRSEGVQVGGVQDYDMHGPVGPTAFWKAADGENPRGALLEGISGVMVDAAWPQGVLPADENDMIFLDGNGEDDDEDDSWDADLDPVADELPGLLLDAEMDLVDVALHHPSPAV
ncbi:FBOX protein [Geosmithia morbida]|uniref:FBOX protein n=1 Tax=Geosmithia morbida TaxID=1094350 RepID=A0A9P5D9K4_9HYPO|nr:FBOX protein [Geosmithia morbida]KAF4126619.1 FBOX protein [Geosmithia morbida]